MAIDPTLQSESKVPKIHQRLKVIDLDPLSKGAAVFPRPILVEQPDRSGGQQIAIHRNQFALAVNDYVTCVQTQNDNAWEIIGLSGSSAGAGQYKAQVSSNDTTPNYLENKLTETSGDPIDLFINNEGGNESIGFRISMDANLTEDTSPDKLNWVLEEDYASGDRSKVTINNLVKNIDIDIVTVSKLRESDDGGDALTADASGDLTAAGDLDITGHTNISDETVVLSNGLNSDIAITADIVQITGPTAAFSVGGFTPSSKILILINNTVQTMTIVNQDASSTTEWRINTGTGANVNTGRAILVYSPSRWFLISSS